MFQFYIPSWVAFTDDGATLVGEAARNHAGADPEAVIFGFKRLLGLRSNVMWGRQYSRRPRTRGAAGAELKGAHGLEEPKEV
ncbi:uncharacterized protein LOC111257545 [Setaria italica]|uniref:uncharacterized protein LOC111257545 n=1 Tax=Setaria italica TaxID=4555 RepID=UPI000BE4CBF1|nr:uncharacterized protein LOC111257545 [Setaria italica]